MGVFARPLPKGKGSEEKELKTIFDEIVKSRKNLFLSSRQKPQSCLLS